MRKIVVHMQATLDNRISNARGSFWEPFPWGDAEQAYVNEAFRAADTWILTRPMYEAIVPWWDEVNAGRRPDDAPEITPAVAAFADLQHELTKVVISNAMESTAARRVLSGDLATELRSLKEDEGRDILLSCGPRTLGPLASTPGLIDEYVIGVHPAVITNGPRMFDLLTSDLALDLVEARVFDAGAVVLRYRVLGAQDTG